MVKWNAWLFSTEFAVLHEENLGKSKSFSMPNVDWTSHAGRGRIKMSGIFQLCRMIIFLNSTALQWVWKETNSISVMKPLDLSYVKYSLILKPLLANH